MRERVVYLRDKLGLSDTQLAKAIGVQQSTIFSLTSGRTETFRKINKLAEALGTTSQWLLTGQETPKDVPAKYSEVIAKLIIDATINGKKPSEEVGKAMQAWLNASITDDIKQGLELDVERYKRLLQNIKDKT